MTREELEEAMKIAYRKGYEDCQHERDFDFHSHSYIQLDDFNSRTCESCRYKRIVDCEILKYVRYLENNDDFGCNRWEKKQ